MRIIKLADFLLGSFLCAIVPARRKNAAINTAPRCVLVIRPGGIGDAVFLLPILAAIKEHYPATRVDILCEKRNLQIFSSQSHLCNSIYHYDHPTSFAKLWQNRYDTIIDTEQWHYSSALVGYFLRSNHTVGFESRPLRRKLFHQGIDYDIAAFELDNFKRLFRCVFSLIETVRLRDSFEVPKNNLDWAGQRISEKSVTLFLGGSLPQKRLNQEQSVAIVRCILDKKFQPVLLGGQDAFKDSEKVANAIDDPKLLNLVGKITLSQSAAAIRHSRLFVGTDSGLLHIACALGVPTVSVFGSSDPRKWGPQEQEDTVLTDRVPCSPCTYFGYSLPTCEGSFFCMNKFDVNKICTVINAKLGAV